ncbi:hypothetical protein S83_028919, partial [Arachis hypogaea]
NLLRGEPLKLVHGERSQLTFLYIKDAIEVVLLMIRKWTDIQCGKPRHEVSVKELVELMIQ